MSVELAAGSGERHERMYLMNLAEKSDVESDKGAAGLCTIGKYEVHITFIESRVWRKVGTCTRDGKCGMRRLTLEVFVMAILINTG
jgi:hypothetical protein